MPRLTRAVFILVLCAASAAAAAPSPFQQAVTALEGLDTARIPGGRLYDQALRGLHGMDAKEVVEGPPRRDCPILLRQTSFKALQEPTPDFDALISPVHNGAGTVVDPAGAGAVFAQLSPPELVAAALPRLLAEPHGPRSTPIEVTAERWGRLPRTYVECTADRTIPIASQRKMQAMSPGAKVVTLDSDHSPYLCCPQQLAEALIGAIPAA